MQQYRSGPKFLMTRMRFAATRAAIRPLVNWTRLSAPKTGYSVIIGCSVDLRPILCANLQMLVRQRRPNLDRVMCVFNCTPDEAARLGIEAPLRERFGNDLPLQFVYYTPLQDRIIGAFNWGWTYSWMNWSLALAECPTQYALIHDLDAMLVRPTLLEERFVATRDAGVQFCGTSHYHCNGLVPADELLTTFEMVVDVPFLRERFRPIDLFNLPTTFKGRRVEFDTLLWAQTVAGKGLKLPIDVRDMVHPSQMICQFVAVRGRAAYTPPANNNVLMIPHFMELGGDARVLVEHQQALDESHGASVRCFGRSLDFSNFSRQHAQWLTEQGHRLDAAVHGAVRPTVRRYFDALQRIAAHPTPLRLRAA